MAKILTPDFGINRPLAFHKLVGKIIDRKKRNLVRGYAARPTLSGEEIKNIRLGNSAADAVVIGSLLRGPSGLISSPNRAKQTVDVFRMSSTQPIDWKSELNFAIGYLNAMESEVLRILPYFEQLACFDRLDTLTSLSAMQQLAEDQGASNYLAYKIAYLRSAREFQTPEVIEALAKLEDQVGHRLDPGLHFSAVENVSPKIALFSVAQRRVSSYASRIQGTFRSVLSLHNFVPTPINYLDLGPFILRMTECSLCDTLYAFLVLLSLAERFPEAQQEMEQSLRVTIFDGLKLIVERASRESPDAPVTEFYASQNQAANHSLSLYRVASAFLERRSLAQYRHGLDRVISIRMLADVVDLGKMQSTYGVPKKSQLLAPSETIISKVPCIRIDTFMRTALFLEFVSNKLNFGSLSDEEIRFIFENTMSLDSLLTEKELTAFSLSAESQARALIAVLSLALYRAKSIDPDVDFEFRDDFVAMICDEYDGSIKKFIDFLVEESPQVATYMVHSLDEVTLEKMYLLVKNATQASEIRSEILRTVGTKLKRVEFFVEADSIHTRSKFAKLQKYFDSSRMYVDSIALKKWLDSNPTVSTEQYKTIAAKDQHRKAKNDLTEPSSLELKEEYEYLVLQIAKDAFYQFCTNNEFGIESYLGRRIRHNTLEGVTTAPVIAVLKNDAYSMLLGSPSMKRNVENWLQAYQDIISRLRHDKLQFDGPTPLFDSALNAGDTFTKENIKTLIAQLGITNSDELLNDLIIAFCWRQIAPQLEGAAREIKTKVLTDSITIINKFFGSMNGALEHQLASELRVAVNETLRRVADWFQVPQTGFIPATVTQLGQIILDESTDAKPVNYVGNAVESRYTGISVHRLYDCLAALLKNACIHGAPGETIKIEANSCKVDDSHLLEEVSVTLTSRVPQAEYEHAKSRISGAISVCETGDEMITEGYTGIRKVKFITRGSEGHHTVQFSFDDSSCQLSLGFSIRVECATDENRLAEAA
ncbi:hypothetical protein [Undibacterium sp. Tian12W]|uniref:hypothetical protein n=1 Tax=Undibacterium sp. Tian12W TaxID=3413054 RepID=UPI003BF48E8D